jgi:hypothetical protein
VEKLSTPIALPQTIKKLITRRSHSSRMPRTWAMTLFTNNRSKLMKYSTVFCLTLLAAFSVGFGHGYLAETGRKKVAASTAASTQAPRSLAAGDDLPSVEAFLRQKGIIVATDDSVCSSRQIYGWHRAWSNKIILCSKQIKADTSSEQEYKALLEVTLTHEAVHVAQFCRRKDSGIPYLGVDAAKLYALSPSMQSQIKNSYKIANTQLIRSLAWRVEAEALYYETRPQEVSRQLALYC